MTGLQGDMYYRIELRAHNAIGHSEPTSIIMRTARGESTNAFGSLTYNYGSVGGALGSGASGANPSVGRSLPALLLTTTTMVLLLTSTAAMRFI